MNDNSDIVESGKILEIKVGSHLYGTSRPDSDTDYSGVIIPPLDFYFGLKKIEEVDLSTKSKLDSGKNAPDAVDKKFYELRRFAGLALQNNPNILEQLFVPENCIIHCDYFGHKLLSMRELFPWRGCVDRFFGYATAQRKKIFIKKENYEGLEEFLFFLEKHKDRREPDNLIRDLCGFENSPPGVRDEDEFFLFVGDLKIQKNIKISHAITQVKQRVEKFGHRRGIVEAHGYDTKFASHLLRLLLEGRRLVLNGVLEFPLPWGEASIIKDIQAGNFKLSEIENLADNFKDEIEASIQGSPLPKKPRFKEIHERIISIIAQYHAGKPCGI